MSSFCNLCPVRPFLIKEPFLAHMKTHEAQYPHCCQKCGWRYSKKRHLRYHLLSGGCLNKFSSPIKTGDKNISIQLSQLTPEVSSQMNFAKPLGHPLREKMQVRGNGGFKLGGFTPKKKILAKKTRFNRYKAVLRKYISMKAQIRRRFLGPKGSTVQVWKCHMCPMKFWTKISLLNHMNKAQHFDEFVKPATGEETYFCKYCKLKFKTCTELESHQRSHPSERSANLQRDSRPFGSAGNLHLTPQAKIPFSALPENRIPKLETLIKSNSLPDLVQNTPAQQPNVPTEMSRKRPAEARGSTTVAPSSPSNGDGLLNLMKTCPICTKTMNSEPAIQHMRREHPELDVIKVQGERKFLNGKVLPCDIFVCLLCGVQFFLIKDFLKHRFLLHDNSANKVAAAEAKRMKSSAMSTPNLSSAAKSESPKITPTPKPPDKATPKPPDKAAPKPPDKPVPTPPTSQKTQKSHVPLILKRSESSAGSSAIPNLSPENGREEHQRSPSLSAQSNASSPFASQSSLNNQERDISPPQASDTNRFQTLNRTDEVIRGSSPNYGGSYGQSYVRTPAGLVMQRPPWLQDPRTGFNINPGFPRPVSIRPADNLIVQQGRDQEGMRDVMELYYHRRRYYEILAKLQRRQREATTRSTPSGATVPIMSVLGPPPANEQPAAQQEEEQGVPCVISSVYSCNDAEELFPD